MNLTPRSRSLRFTRPATVAAAVAASLAIGLPTAALAAPAGPVSPTAHSPASAPAKFKAASISFLSAKRGWLLGSAPCRKKSCTDVLTTSNGGTSWSLAGSIKAPIATPGTPSDVGVDEVRPATTSIGWAYGPALFRTANGGKTWTAQPIPGKGHQVLALGSSSTATYAVVSPCKEFASCTTGKLTIWRTASLTGKTWTRIPASPRSLAVNAAASISTSGKTVYVVSPGLPGQLLASTDGRHFAARRSPCNAAKDFGLAGVSATSASHVALLCVGNPGRSEATKTVYRSVNTGKTVTSAGSTGVFGIESELAASSNGDLLVASRSDGSFMYANDGGKSKWTMPLGLDDNGAGLNDLAFVSGKVAWAVYGPITDFAGNLGKLFVTKDGGQHWTKITV